MPLLGQDDTQAIKKEFDEHIADDVTILLLGPSALNPPARDLTSQIRQLYGEVAALSPRVKLEYIDSLSAEERAALAREPDDPGPVTVVRGAGKGKVRFFGAPSGHEFPSFVRTLMDVSRGESWLSAESRQALAQLRTPVHIKVFFTPT
jgi:alkyl hydroperoxide reductase subunit AhpF